MENINLKISLTNQYINKELLKQKLRVNLDKGITLSQAIDKSKAKELYEKQLNTLRDEKEPNIKNINTSRNKSQAYVALQKNHNMRNMNKKQDNYGYCGYKDHEHFPAKGAMCNSFRKDNFSKECNRRMNRMELINRIYEDSDKESDFDRSK